MVLLILSSCTSTRDIIYFDIDKDLTTRIEDINNEAVIQKNDLLGITVSSLSEQASAIYNPPGVANNSNSMPSYLVNEEGFIDFPVIGRVKAAGRTKSQLQKDLTDSLLARNQLLQPVVGLRIINYRVTVLGEVTRPTVVSVPSEKINLLEAIGFAGDMTIYADRSNVLLIREENGQRTFKVMNMNSNEVFSSPYFYLKPNDVVYVRPNKVKIGSSGNVRLWLPVVMSVLTFGVIAIDRLAN